MDGAKTDPLAVIAWASNMKPNHQGYFPEKLAELTAKKSMPARVMVGTVISAGNA